MIDTSNKRVVGIDMLRCLAIFTIISQHFFTRHTHFKDVPYEGLSLFFQGVALEFFLIGVPLFVAISGYLNSEKKYQKYIIEKFLK